MSCFTSFDALCRKVVAPTRYDINEKDMISRKFRGKPPVHHLVSVVNRRGQALSVLLFPKNMRAFPTVLYLHGNGGNKLQVLNIVRHAGQAALNFCAFDFSGCGKSEGEYLTYGQREVQDIGGVVRFLRDYFGVTRITIWGRSMGASIGMMYAAECASGIVESMVLDSPFRTLSKILLNVASENQQNIPTFLIRLAIYFVKRNVESIVERQVFEEDYSSALPIIHQRKIPLLFGFSRRDTVVKKEDVTELYDMYSGEKCLYEFDCLHPQDRPEDFVKAALEFISEQPKRRHHQQDKTNSGRCHSKRQVARNERSKTTTYRY